MLSSRVMQALMPQGSRAGREPTAKRGTRVVWRAGNPVWALHWKPARNRGLCLEAGGRKGGWHRDQQMRYGAASLQHFVKPELCRAFPRGSMPVKLKDTGLTLWLLYA